MFDDVYGYLVEDYDVFVFLIIGKVLYLDIVLVVIICLIIFLDEYCLYWYV